MNVNKVIKGAKTIGKSTLKGFVKGGKFIGRNTMRAAGGIIKSSPAKKVAGIGMTVGTMYLFGPAIVTARLFKDLVIDNCILGKQKSAMESVKNSVQATYATLQKSVADPGLEKLGRGVRKAGEKIFSKGGER